MTGHVETARAQGQWMGTKTSTMQHVFRQRSPLGLAVVCGVTGLILLVSLARNWADYPRPLFVAWVLFGLACVWSIFVRPAVLLDVEGVTVRNVVRDVHIPWARLTDVESRWNLKVFAGERGYTAWAISSHVERPKGISGGMLSRRAPEVTAAMVARLIEQAKEDYDEAVARGQLPASPDSPVRITWVPLVIAILLLPVFAVVALSVT